MSKIPATICIALLLLGGCVSNTPQGPYAPTKAHVVANYPQGVPGRDWNVFLAPYHGYNAARWRPWPVESEGCLTFPVHGGYYVLPDHGESGEVQGNSESPAQNTEIIERHPSVAPIEPAPDKPTPGEPTPGEPTPGEPTPSIPVPNSGPVEPDNSGLQRFPVPFDQPPSNDAGNGLPSVGEVRRLPPI